eukprot:6682-Hanusia_phi.AAC.1
MIIPQLPLAPAASFKCVHRGGSELGRWELVRPMLVRVEDPVDRNDAVVDVLQPLHDPGGHVHIHRVHVMRIFLVPCIAVTGFMAPCIAVTGFMAPCIAVA